MTSIISSNHYVAKLEINLHIINFCHDYFMLCDTEISVYKGVLPVKTDRVSSGISNQDYIPTIIQSNYFIFNLYQLKVILAIFLIAEHHNAFIVIYAALVNQSIHINLPLQLEHITQVFRKHL